MTNYFKLKEVLEKLIKDKNNCNIDEYIKDINKIYFNKKISNVFIFKKDVDYLFNLCCNYFNISKNELKSPSKKINIVLPRQICMHILYEYKAETLKGIGEMFGNREHSTVIFACKQINNMIDIKDQGYEKYFTIKNNFDNYLKNRKIN